MFWDTIIFGLVLPSIVSFNYPDEKLKRPLIIGSNLPYSTFFFEKITHIKKDFAFWKISHFEKKVEKISHFDEIKSHFEKISYFVIKTPFLKKISFFLKSTSNLTRNIKK